MKIKNYCFIIISCFIFSFSFSQNKDLGTITGNAESIFQYLNEDTLIGATSRGRSLYSEFYESKYRAFRR